jgi:hypothetical protein
VAVDFTINHCYLKLGRFMVEYSQIHLIHNPVSDQGFGMTQLCSSTKK